MTHPKKKKNSEVVQMLQDDRPDKLASRKFKFQVHK